MADKYPLPEKFQLTPERLAKAEEEQKIFAAASPFASTSPAQMEINRANILIRDLEKGLEEFKWNRKFSQEEKTATREALATRLAEAYAVTGRFDKAAQLETNKEKKAEYKAFWNAVIRDDSETCDCPDQMGDIQLSNEYVKAEVYSIKHNKMMPVVACRACGCLNVTALPERQSVLRAARKRSIALVGKANKNQAKEILVRNKMQTGEVIK